MLKKRLAVLFAIFFSCTVLWQCFLETPENRRKNILRLEILSGFEELPPISDPQAPRQGPENNILLAFAEGKKIPQKGIMLSNNLAICIKDKYPVAKHHLLIIPRERIESIRSLKISDVPLLRAMKTLGKACLEKDGGSLVDSKFFFHRPPFTSQDHLHLHTVSGYFTLQGLLKLPFADFSISIDDTIAQLEKGLF